MTHDSSRVCVGCFADPSLVELVRTRLERGADTCAHCRRKRVRAAPAWVVAEQLTDFVWGFFEPVEEQWEGASELGELLYDFGVLSDAAADWGRAEGLVAEILGANRRRDEESLELDRWRCRRPPRYPAAPRWYLRELRDRVDEYGHALDHVLDTRELDHGQGRRTRQRLDDDLRHLEESVGAGTTLFRARIGFELTGRRGLFGRLPGPLRGADIAAPPAHLSRSDRVAVAGQRVLFLAESRDTAIAEVRPAIGDRVSSAAFVVPRDLRVIDLTRRQVPSGDVATMLNQLRRYTLAEEIGREFAVPVGSDGAKRYLLTQYVARRIERLGFDGIKYPSSQRPDGFNLVVFDCSICGEPGEHALTEVNGVSYSLGEHDFDRADDASVEEHPAGFRRHGHVGVHE